MVGAPEKPLELPVFPLLMGKHMQNNTKIFIKRTLVIEPMFGVMVDMLESRQPTEIYTLQQYVVVILAYQCDTKHIPNQLTYILQ